MSKKEKKKRTAGDIIRNLILVIAIGVFAFSAFQLGKIFLEYKAGTDEYNRVREYVTVTEPEPEQEQEETQTEPEAEEAKPVPPQVDFDSLKAINPDVIGWIQIEGTSISYPIMKGTDNEYYLKHTFEGNYNAAGSIFIDYTNNSNFEDCNTIIYGHNMRNTTMFGDLKRYKNDEGFYEKNQFFNVYTADKVYRYQIFSYYDVDEDSDIYTVGYGADDSWQAMIDKMVASSMKDTGIHPTKEDKVVTLSTCSKAGETKRFVVHGVLVDVKTH